jgi:hypothetical protein
MIIEAPNQVNHSNPINHGSDNQFNSSTKLKPL